MAARLYRLMAALLVLLVTLPAAAQKRESRDSLVRLMSAASVRLLEIDGESYREAIDANFLHNDTYLICDTALWNVATNVIRAYSHVKIIQDETQLTSEEMTYRVDENLAQFRGHLVQLTDKDGNTLRTRNLDYNTKDSLAVFFYGASMRDKDGQIIESIDGNYDSRAKRFVFENNVNMYTDSVFINTSRLDYQSDSSKAYFDGGLDAWKDKNMLSSLKGWYNKEDEQFFFEDTVHGMSSTQEIWCDSLFYWRLLEDVQMLGHVQVTDTTRGVSAMAEEMFYRDSIATLTMERDATVSAETEEQGKRDTVFVSAARIVYRDVPQSKIPEAELAASAKRLEEVQADPVSTYRRKAAEEAAKAAEEAAKDDPNNAAEAARKRQERAEAENAVAEEAASENAVAEEDPVEGETVEEENAPDEAVGADGAAVEPVSDEEPAADDLEGNEIAADDEVQAEGEAFAGEAAAGDENAPGEAAPEVEVVDTVKVGFLSAKGNVKVFRTDMQAVCDSLEYTDLDSLARLYIDPIVWNEGNRQYRSDSLTVIIKNRKMDRASLMSNAFIVIREDSLCFDQIKGAEIMAYFDEATTLRRFDALGGANAIFYLKENDEFATVNKVESKMLSAIFSEGEIDTIYYFDNPKNDAYPVVQFPKEEKELKGFTWVPELRPTGRQDITNLVLRDSERVKYDNRSRPDFTFTERFFPGYLSEVYTELARIDSLRQVARARADVDTLAVDTVFVSDSLNADVQDDVLAAEVSAADSLLNESLAAQGLADSLATAEVLTEGIAATDSLVLTDAVPEVEVDPRAAKREEAEIKRQERLAEREAKWAELDARDAEKKALEQAREDEKRRSRTYKALMRQEKRAAKEQKQLDRYVEKYRRKQNKERERLSGKEPDNVQDNL